VAEYDFLLFGGPLLRGLGNQRKETGLGLGASFYIGAWERPNWETRKVSFEEETYS